MCRLKGFSTFTNKNKIISSTNTFINIQQMNSELQITQNFAVGHKILQVLSDIHQLRKNLAIKPGNSVTLEIHINHFP